MNYNRVPKTHLKMDYLVDPHVNGQWANAIECNEKNKKVRWKRLARDGTRGDLGVGVRE